MGQDLLSPPGLGRPGLTGTRVRQRPGYPGRLLAALLWRSPTTLQTLHSAVSGLLGQTRLSPRCCGQGLWAGVREGSRHSPDLRGC